VVLDRWPTAQAVKDAPREAQVDAVIASLLGGGVSTDTRQILITGRNPFLEANPNAAADTSLMIDVDPPEMMIGGGRRPARERLANARRAPRQLDPFAQIVGLALGSPEFQRR
jgi:hypothetical protein